MCTAATYKTKDFYFGRTLDYDFSYNEEIVITPRNYNFEFRNMGSLQSHYAIIGMAYVQEEFPLYYDATNEKGLSMAGLNFVGNAVYKEKIKGKENIAQFEFVSWVLSKCKSVYEAKKLIENINITNEPFSPQLPVSSLHWIIADREECIVLESVEEGIKVYDNPVGVLTNNPPFPKQLLNLNNYMALSNKDPENTFSKTLNLKTYSRGMGAIGLPGDLSSMSRFVRVAFVKSNSISKEDESSSVSQFFHILGSVDQQRGCCQVENGEYEITIYASCCNTDKGIYYYKTYDNHSISAVDMHRENLEGENLIKYPLIKDLKINIQN